MPINWIRGEQLPLPTPPGTLTWCTCRCNGTVIVVAGTVGSTLIITVSSDNGATWTVATTPVLTWGQGWQVLEWNGAVWCLAGFSSGVTLTSPTGYTWTQQAGKAAGSAMALAMAFGNSFLEFTSTYTSGYWHSTDNGVSWTQYMGLPTPFANARHGWAWNGTTLVIVNGASSMARLNSVGGTWGTATTTAGAPYVIPGTSHFGLIGGAGGSPVVQVNKISTDGGATWTSRGTPLPTMSPGVYTQVRPSTARSEVWVAFHNRIFVSTDGGVNFVEQPGAVSNGLYWRDITHNGTSIFALQSNAMYRIVDEATMLEPDYLLEFNVPVVISESVTFRVDVPDGLRGVHVDLSGGTGTGEVKMSLGPYNGTSWDYDNGDPFVHIDNPAAGLYYGRVDSTGLDNASLVATIEKFWTGHSNTAEA